jgi:alkylation response protein AidB-like acyl-CoA dehydrogenase
MLSSDEYTAIWKEVAALGWTSVAVAEDRGGGGGSLIDALIIAENLAGGLVPVPFLGSAIMAPALAKAMPEAEATRVLDRVVAGEAFAIAFDDHLRMAQQGPATIAWDWLPGAGIIGLRGSEPVVLPDVNVEPLACQDPFRLIGRIRGPGTAGVAGDETTAGRAVGMVATATALCGVMRGASELAVQYAKVREQFGRPIGSFQAVQHMCADMHVDLEASRSAAYGAGWAVDTLGPAEALQAAATAKAWCSDAAIRVCETAVQVHGGMGFTWECDAHLYLRAAHVLCAAVASREDAVELVAKSRFAGRGFSPVQVGS